jgi:hypothetical protein
MNWERACVCGKDKWMSNLVGWGWDDDGGGEFEEATGVAKKKKI